MTHLMGQKMTPTLGGWGLPPGSGGLVAFGGALALGVGGQTPHGGDLALDAPCSLALPCSRRGCFADELTLVAPCSPHRCPGRPLSHPKPDRTGADLL